MPLSREDRETLTRRQAALSGIIKHPSWDEYAAEHKRKIARNEMRMLRTCKSEDGANQRLLDYLRGYNDALDWEITMPEAAERNLIRYLRSQGLEIEEEDEANV